MERLQKLLANAGFGSRREIETWIQEGRIKVNGKTAKLGDRASAQDKIELDQEALKFKLPEKRKVLLYHKPEGEICTQTDPEGRGTVFESLPPLANGRWIMVGRLDLNTSGLLLFTNDGELANRLMHPKYQIEREYAVRILGDVDGAMIERLLQGVQLEDGMAKFSDIQLFGGRGANVWYHVVLMEGRQREVRRLWESQGVTVSRLIRVRYGHVFLPRSLRSGKWKELDSPTINKLLKQVGLPSQEAPRKSFKSKSPQKRRKNLK